MEKIAISGQSPLNFFCVSSYYQYIYLFFGGFKKNTNKKKLRFIWSFSQIFSRFLQIFLVKWPFPVQLNGNFISELILTLDLLIFGVFKEKTQIKKLRFIWSFSQIFIQIFTDFFVKQVFPVRLSCNFFLRSYYQYIYFSGGFSEKK